MHDQTYLGRKTLRTTLNMDRLIRDDCSWDVVWCSRENEKKTKSLFWGDVAPQQFSAQRIQTVRQNHKNVPHNFKILHKAWCIAVLYELFHWQALTTRCQWVKVEYPLPYFGSLIVSVTSENLRSPSPLDVPTPHEESKTSVSNQTDNIGLQQITGQTTRFWSFNLMNLLDCTIRNERWRSAWQSNELFCIIATAERFHPFD